MMTGSSPRDKPIYFSNAYLQTQNGDQVVSLTVADEAHGYFYRYTNTLVSLKYSPFGSFWSSNPISPDDFSTHFRLFENQQRKNGTEKIIITTPPDYYPGFIPSDWILKEGFEKKVSETNQFIDLTSEITLHKMELRKLKTLQTEDWKLQEVPLNDFKKLHDFLSVCRSQQQLEINVDWHRLSDLITNLPTTYEGWVLAKNGDWAAAVIMVRVTDTIVYYYLPGTHQKFKNSSPMVRLLNDLIQVYQQDGFHVIDLGISSVDGKLQEGLYNFKQHMGAKSCDRNTYHKSLVG